MPSACFSGSETGNPGAKERSGPQFMRFNLELSLGGGRLTADVRPALRLGIKQLLGQELTEPRQLVSNLWIFERRRRLGIARRQIQDRFVGATVSCTTLTSGALLGAFFFPKSSTRFFPHAPSDVEPPLAPCLRGFRAADPFGFLSLFCGHWVPPGVFST